MLQLIGGRCSPHKRDGSDEHQYLARCYGEDESGFSTLVRMVEVSQTAVEGMRATQELSLYGEMQQREREQQ